MYVKLDQVNLCDLKPNPRVYCYLFCFNKTMRNLHWKCKHTPKSGQLSITDGFEITFRIFILTDMAFPEVDSTQSKIYSIFSLQQTDQSLVKFCEANTYHRGKRLLIKVITTTRLHTTVRLW